MIKLKDYTPAPWEVISGGFNSVENHVTGKKINGASYTLKQDTPELKAMDAKLIEMAPMLYEVYKSAVNLRDSMIDDIFEKGVDEITELDNAIKKLEEACGEWNEKILQ